MSIFGFRFFFGKDGGPESKVYGYFLENKRLFSIVLLRFDEGTREAYHSHAFNSVSWLLRGQLAEAHLNGLVDLHTPRLRPILTARETFHKVASSGTSWVLSFRGPWAQSWIEYDSETKKATKLFWGRREQA